MTSLSYTGPRGLRRTFLLAFAVGVAAGLFVGIATGLSGAAPAATQDLTRAQARRIDQAHGLLWRILPHTDGRGRGLCQQFVAAERERLIAMGVRPDALSVRWVSVPRRWRTEPFHVLLDLDARVDGRPWTPTFDMNSARPLGPAEVRAIGYRPGDWTAVFARKP
jgi:hypothetical protein